ncbi:MAG TPA: hypothetical protein VGC93_19050, partial [Thermoanaerobaculia bacterium]
MTRQGRKAGAGTAARRRGGGRRPLSGWRLWAAALRGRYRLRPSGPAGPERVLARPRAAAHFLRERWLLATRTLLPQIHLAIQPLLRPCFWRNSAVLAA